jgi:ubiquinone/menaquinone biosynthesis C-methylase UbiE
MDAGTHRRNHPLFARLYAGASGRAERAGQAALRAELLAGARGRALELGAGNGLTFAHYPAAVEAVVAVEPEPFLRRRAIEAAATARVPVEVVDGVADALPAPDGAFDVAVTSLVLCSVPDQAAALAELHRVLRAGGELRFYEHVVAQHPAAARLQAGLDRTGLWPLVAGGCHLARDTLGAVEAAGFAVERVRRLRFPPGPLGLPHVLGIARRP